VSRVATRREVVREVEGEVCAARGELGSRWLAGDVSLADKTLGEVVAALGGMRGVYAIRGAWTSEHYTSLRNAAWLVRAARHGKENNPVALAVVVAECVRLVSVGEELGDVVEALCELLVHP